MSWTGFPADIRRKILGIVLEAPKTFTYSAVCREWQAVFEKKHFERLVLSRDDLLYFAAIVYGPRARLVKHIVLRVVLDTYTYTTGRMPENGQVCWNNYLFTSTIKHLFIALGAWERPRGSNREGLTFELCVCSLSEPRQIPAGLNLPYLKPRENFHNPYAPSYIDSRFRDGTYTLSENFQDSAPGLGHAITSLGDSWFEPWWVDLPVEVDVITTFLVRREHYRRINTLGLGKILKSLVGLRQVIYEHGEDAFYHPQLGENPDYRKTFEHSLPRTLKSLVLFENQDLPEKDQRTYPIFTIARSREECLRFGSALEKASRSLEHLSVSFVVDALDFFNPFRSAGPNSALWVRHELQTISLTSTFLDPNPPGLTGGIQGLDNLILLASFAAKSMPNLQVMEIWNGTGDEHGCIFRYCYEETAATITWHSTWDFKLADRVIQSWSQTTHRRNPNIELNIVYIRLVTDGIAFPASVLRHLKLKDRVLHPTSYRQLQLIGEPGS
ncbi:hypothetical protein F4806DRAFT_197214 [Annulohypoxylon nitens]|nr:hypothetical protein F4806DRAFT_197214 [Annulohypoxylon nitens]